MTSIPVLAFPAPTPSEPVGVIAEAHGPVVLIARERLLPLRRALSTVVDGDTYLFEVHQHLDPHHAGAITLHYTTGLRRGMPVYDTGAPLHVPVGGGCLGRVLNVFGEPRDGGAILERDGFRNIHGTLSRQNPSPTCEKGGKGARVDRKETE